MRTLIVGDIHGKVPFVERALAQEHPVIFVGDICDSFDRPTKDHIKCFELIFKAIDEGKATCLYGNHELSYLMPEHRCSGWNVAMQAHIDGGLRHEMAGRFDYFQLYDNILITHAGLDKRIWDKFDLNLDNLAQTLAEWCHIPGSPAHWIGKFRGGWHTVGGIFWCDFDHEFQEIPELIQIVGHTRGTELRRTGNSYCIDYNDWKSNFFYWELPDDEGTLEGNQGNATEEAPSVVGLVGQENVHQGT